MFRFRYGNYLGNKYNCYPKEPIDEIDFCCFMHDIDHKLSGGNNYYADQELLRRLKLIDKSKFSFYQHFILFLAKNVYCIFYGLILRNNDIINLFMVKNNYGRTREEDSIKFENSKDDRIRRYRDDSSIWDNYDYKKFI